MLLLVALVVFVAMTLPSCSSKSKTATTTYQIINDMPLVPNQSGDKYLDNSIYEVWVDCYVGSSIVKTDKFDKIAPAGGKCAVTSVDATITKLKISCKVLPPQDPYYNIAQNARIYLYGYTTIVENINNIVTITYDTPIDGMNGGSLTFGVVKNAIIIK